MNNVKPEAEAVSIDQLLDQYNLFTGLFEDTGNVEFDYIRIQILETLRKGG